MDRDRLVTAGYLLAAAFGAVLAVAFAYVVATTGPSGLARVVYAGGAVGGAAGALGFGLVARDRATRRGGVHRQLANSGGTLSALAGGVLPTVLTTEYPWQTLFVSLYALLLAAGVALVVLSLDAVRRRAGLDAVP